MALKGSYSKMMFQIWDPGQLLCISTVKTHFVYWLHKLKNLKLDNVHLTYTKEMQTHFNTTLIQTTGKAHSWWKNTKNHKITLRAKLK